MSGLLLAGVGDGREPVAFSGIPFHLLAEGRRDGLIEDDLGLDTLRPSWTVRRLGWNIGSVAMGRGRGGFQFTDCFLEPLWRPAKMRIRDRHVVNWTQLYPFSVLSDERVRRSYFIDQTLSQVFDNYGVGASIRGDVAADALRREAAGYRMATAIVVHSEWARRSVIDIDGVDPSRVHVVVPGANLEPDAYRVWAQGERTKGYVAGGPLRLVFVGRDPVRKGLDRLLRAVASARAAGCHLLLDVVGTRRDEVDIDLQRTEGVTWHGRIDKASDARRFFQVVAGAHVGCLLSRAEAGGIGLREYHALGLAVIGPDVGGSPDHVLQDAAVLVDPMATDAQVTDLLADLAGNPERVDAMRELSWKRREEVGWSSTVAKLREVLG